MSRPRTPLHKAALFGDSNAAKELLDIKKNNEKNYWMLKDANKELGIQPLDCSAPRGHVEVTKELVRAHRKSEYKYTIKNPQGYHPIVAAAHWWSNIIQGIANGHGTFNKKDPEKAYPIIINLLIDHYDEICDGVEIGQIETAHRTNALYHIVRIMGLEKSRYGDLAEHKKEAGIIAQRLIIKGVSLDIPTNRSGRTARRLAESTGILGKIEAMEEDAKREKEKKDLPAPILLTIKTQQEKKLTSLKEPKNVSLALSKNGKQEIASASVNKIPQLPKKHLPGSSQTILQAVKNTQKPSSFLSQSVGTKKQNDKKKIVPKKQTPVKKETKGQPQSLYKFKLGPERPFSENDAKRIIYRCFPNDVKNADHKNLNEEIEKIINQLKKYPITQNIKTQIEPIIEKNLHIEHTYKGLCCKKVSLLTFDSSNTEKDLDRLFEKLSQTMGSVFQYNKKC